MEAALLPSPITAIIWRHSPPSQRAISADSKARPMPTPQTPPAAMALPPERPFVLAGAYLDQDLDRLADIQARGVVVLLYESPLYPDDAL